MKTLPLACVMLFALVAGVFWGSSRRSAGRITTLVSSTGLMKGYHELIDRGRREIDKIEA